MTSPVNDCKYTALMTQTGLSTQMNDMFLRYLKDNGATSDSIMDAQREFLIAQGATATQLNDMWFEVLVAAGYTGSLADMFQQWWCGDSGDGSDGGSFGATLAFHALTYDPTTYEMLSVKEGVGGLTTTHTSTVYAPDKDGVQRAFGANEPVWSGGRVVENVAIYSEDMDSMANLRDLCTFVDATGSVSPPVAGMGVVEVTAGAGIWKNIANTLSVPVGISATVSCWVQRVSGATSVRMQSPANLSPDLIIDGDWKRFSYSVTSTQSQYGLTRNAASEAVVFNVTGFQLEYNDAPSEYIANLTTGKTTKVYANLNGNTVTNNVVTEAVGAPLPEVPYLQYYPAATNSMLYSNDQTQWTNLNTTSIQDQVGLTGEPNTASLCDDASTSAGNVRNPAITILADTATHAIKVWVKKDTDQTRFPAFSCNGYTNKGDIIGLNTQTGYAWNNGGTGINTVFEVLDEGDWWVMCIQADNDGAQTSFLLPMWPALFLVQDGAQEATATGSIIVGNAEVYQNKTITEVRGLGPIFTTTAAVSTDTTTYFFDYTNHNNDSTVYFCEWQPSFDNADELSNRNIISTITSTNMLYCPLSNAQSTGSWDGNAFASTSNTFGADEQLKLAIVYDRTDNKRSINISGTYGNEATYTGSFAGAQVYVMITAPQAMRMRELQRYNIADYQQGLDQIDDLILPAPDITLDASILGLGEGDPVNVMGFLTSSNPPKYNLAAQAGLNVIKFDGVANEMNGALSVKMTQFSYYVVLKYGTHEDNSGMMSVGPTGGNDWDNDNGVVFAAHGGASNPDEIAIRRGNTGNILSPHVPVVPTDFVLLEGHIDTVKGTVSVRLNGGAEITDTFDSLTPIIPNLFVLGCRVISGAVSTPYSDFSFGEARLYNRLLSNKNRGLIRDEMNAKWFSGLIFSDTFTDINGTLLDAHSPDFDKNGSGWAVPTGSADIQNNKVLFSTDRADVFVDVGMTDVYGEVTMRQQAGQTGSLAVFLRNGDASNNVYLDLVGTNQFRILTQTNDVFVAVATTSVTFKTDTDYVISFECEGDKITAWVDGANEITFTSTFLNTSTLKGLRTDGATSGVEADDFKIYDLAIYKAIKEAT